MAGEVIGKGLADGATFGASASEKISFHGATPVVQQSHIASVTTATNDSAAINSILLVLEAYGLTATA